MIGKICYLKNGILKESNQSFTVILFVPFRAGGRLLSETKRVR